MNFSRFVVFSHGKSDDNMFGTYKKESSAREHRREAIETSSSSNSSSDDDDNDPFKMKPNKFVFHFLLVQFIKLFKLKNEKDIIFLDQLKFIKINCKLLMVKFQKNEARKRNSLYFPINTFA